MKPTQNLTSKNLNPGNFSKVNLSAPFDPALMERQLGPIGWRSSLLAQLAHLRAPAHAATQTSDLGDTYLARVTTVHRETVQLHNGLAEHSASLHPKAINSHGAPAQTIAVGDWALAHVDAFGHVWVLQVLAPQTSIRRLDGDGLAHTVVSNVDTLFVVMGLDSDFNLNRAERYLLIAHASAVHGVLVLTKSDLCRDVDARVDALRARLGAPQEVHAVNARESGSCLLLHPYLSNGQTVALMGSSGAGKSTLTNALLGRAAQNTGAVRDGLSLQGMGGKHTTTARSLFLAPQGGCIIDTPGLRTMRVDGDAASVNAGFADIASLALQCRFRNCSHSEEPDCAVREGVGADRLKNYQKLLRDAKRDTLTALERRELVQTWKQRSAAAKLRTDAGSRGNHH